MYILSHFVILVGIMDGINWLMFCWGALQPPKCHQMAFWRTLPANILASMWWHKKIAAFSQRVWFLSVPVSLVNLDFQGDFNFSLPCHLIMLERRLTCVQSIPLKRDNPNQKQCELTGTTNIRKRKDMHVELNRCCSCPLLR